MNSLPIDPNIPFDPNTPETEEDGYRAGALRIAKYRYQAKKMRMRIEAKEIGVSHIPPEETMHQLKKTSTERKFKITVNYGYDVHSIIVNQNEMAKIRNGESVTVLGQGFSIEGDTEIDDWSFHSTQLNSLEVECENGHQVFVGNLSDAIISEV